MANRSTWTQIDRPFYLPGHVKLALQQLNEAGHTAYIVGGSVRDFLLNREIKDHDIATSATPDELCNIFPDAIEVGKEFGVIKVSAGLPENPSLLLEIATFRKDLRYRNHRHPTQVAFTGPAEDASRRDFTINALFYDPKTQRIMDYVNGLDDLKKGIVRAIGDPPKRFNEDALRLLRAVRFTTHLNFKLEEETAKAVKKHKGLIKKISYERIRDELSLMLGGPNPSKALELLASLGLLPLVLPEITTMKDIKQSAQFHPEGDVWAHTLKSMNILAAHSARRSTTLSWATLLHDVGKSIIYAQTKGKNFNGHEVEGAKITQKVCRRLKMSNDKTSAISTMVLDHLKFKDVFKMREATLIRWLSQPYFEELLELHYADAMSSDGNLAYYEFCSSRLKEIQKTPPSVNLINGMDLVQLGLEPGPQFTHILRTVEDLAMEKKLTTKEEALEFVIKHFVN